MTGDRKQSPLAPRRLRCEYNINPLGIDDAAPRFFWEVNDPRRGAVQTAYRILVASTQDELADDQGDVWDSGRVESDASIQVEYEGAPLHSCTRYHWKICTWDNAGQASPWSDTAWFETGLLRAEDWKAAWISQPSTHEQEAPCPPPHFRKGFATKGSVERARLYITARGVYEASLNGELISQDVFRPGWTDYDVRLPYQTYDVTALLREGENALGVIVGDGWYCGYVGWFGRKIYGDHPQLLAQLHLDYSDGSSEVLATDADWRACAGPILASDMIMGEVHDARRALVGWDKPGVDDDAWEPVAVTQRDRTLLETQRAPSVRRTQTLQPVALHKLDSGAYVFDLGQNMVGRVRLRAQGPAGTTITLRHAEMLQPDKTLYLDNMRSAKVTDVYVMSGEGEEVFEPRFTFHGFQFVEVAGYPGEPTLDDLTGVVLHSDTPPTGAFECSSPMLNKLQQNIQWGQRGNFLEVPTDCPQRDERLGWMGDAQVFVHTAAYNMDVASFFEKWMVDVVDAQRDNGAFTDISPDVASNSPLGAGSAAWGDAGVICPWVIFLCYGDRRMLERHYPAMKRWVAFCREYSDGLIRPATGYGDWLSIEAFTPKDLLATAYFAYSTKLVATIARVLGRTDEADAYDGLFDEIKAAFVREFVTPAGRVSGETQTAYVLALLFDLLPDELRAAAIGYLAADIERRKCHLSTGFVGVGLLLPTLSRVGRDDLAFRLALNETFPSWGYSIKHGATTMWERWDGWTEEGGFQTPAMNSFNHYAFGSVGEWMYGRIAGIDLLEPGYKRFLIRPVPGGGLTHARGMFQSPHGQVDSAWEVADGRFTLRLTLPANTRATVRLPGDALDAAREGDTPFTQAKDLQNPRVEDGETVVDVGAGSYTFVIPYTPPADAASARGLGEDGITGDVNPPE